MPAKPPLNYITILAVNYFFVDYYSAQFKLGIIQGHDHFRVNLGKISGSGINLGSGSRAVEDSKDHSSVQQKRCEV